MYGISYRIRLLEPALVNSPEGDNNTAQSYRFLPGSAIRGAVIAAYLAQPGRSSVGQELDAAEEDARRLFFSGATRYLHAYPYAKQLRGLPAPLSWYQDKDDEVSSEYAIDVFDLSVVWEESGKQLRAIKRDVFCAVTRNSVYQLDYAPRLNVHTQRDALPGRATEERGAIYRYEALPAGASLAGAILTQSADDAEALQKLLNGSTVYFGKARTAGYGGAQFEDVKLLTTNWFETGSDNLYEDDEIPVEMAEAEDAISATTLSEFSITLLSAAIVRDEQGHHTLDLLPALRRRLGVVEESSLRLAVVDKRPLAFRRSELVCGFNRKWNLPLPQVAAITAGSVFKVTAAPPIALDRLRALEETGIGERRAEGFGRIAVNWRPGGVLSYAKLKDEQPTPETVGELSETARRMAEQMLQRLLRRDLDEALVEAVSGINIQGRIANSQLSRWRAVLRSALAEPDNAKRLNRLTDFHAAEEKKASAAWETMRRARVEISIVAGRKEKPRLTDWLKNVLVANNKLHEELGLGSLPERRLGEAMRASVTPDLDLEYRIRLLDASLARKAKQKALEGSGKGGRHENRN